MARVEFGSCGSIKNKLHSEMIVCGRKKILFYNKCSMLINYLESCLIQKQF